MKVSSLPPVTSPHGLWSISQGVKLADCQDTQGSVRMLFLHPRGGSELPVYDRACWGPFLKKQAGVGIHTLLSLTRGNISSRLFPGKISSLVTQCLLPTGWCLLPLVREYLLSILGPRCSGPQGKLWLLSGQMPWTFRETRNQTGYAPGSWRGSLWVLWPRPGVPMLHEEDFTWLYLMCHLLFSPTAI